ncbi:MAG: shikimate kinase [Clostridia bacterium]
MIELKNKQKESIAIVCMNYEYNKKLCCLLAEKLGMYYFNAVDLFEYEHIPRSFEQILTEFKEKYYRKKEKAILKYASSFTNSVLCLESGAVMKQRNMKNLKHNDLLVYVHIAKKKLENQQSKTSYGSKILNAFYKPNTEKLELRIKYAKKTTELQVNCTGFSVERAVAQIINSMKVYYAGKSLKSQNNVSL